MSDLIPRLCEGGTVVCLASGPSLTTEDVQAVRGKATVIAINDTVRLAPWADVLYTSDGIWYRRHLNLSFPGLKVRIHNGKWKEGDKARRAKVERGWIVLRNTGERGLELERDALRTYKNSGGSAINLAVHLGAKRVLLLGYDMGIGSDGRHHFYEKHATAHHSPYHAFRKLIATMVEPLNTLGVEVINCSRRTALECFQRQPLSEALGGLEQAA